MNVLDFIQHYSVDLVLIASALLLLVLYLAAYVRARRPKEGTLEWIRMYDRQRFSLTGTAALSWRSVGVAALAGLCSTAVLVLRYWVLMHASAYRFADIFTSRYFLGELATAACGGGAMALLVQALLQDKNVGLCAGILYSFAFVSQTRGAALLVLSLFCLWQWLRQDSFAAPLRALPWLLGSMILLALSVVYCWSILWLVPLYVAAYVMKLISRARAAASGGKAISCWLSVPVVVLLTVLGAIALWGVVKIRLGTLSARQFPAKLLTLDCYREMLQDLPLLMRSLLPRFAATHLRVVRYDWPVFLCGMLSLAAMLVGAICRHDTSGVAIGVLSVWLLLIWVFTGAYLLPVGLIPAIAYLWQGFRQRKNPMPVYLCFGLGAAYYIIHWCYLYL